MQLFCESQGYRFCFIGGLAVQRWGEPRVTNDADLTLITGWGTEEKFIEALLRKFRARRDDAAEFALQRRVLLLQAANDVPLDIALAAIPFEERTVERASPWAVSPEVGLTTCGAEDLLIHKAFAGRGLDWLDVERILQRQNRKLDFQLIFAELHPLLALKEEPENEDRLRQLMEREGLL
ncbi:MAG: nucleotidyl transferase AbiEii/AbiGii toxin family protein [Chthoniobacterales bacterium]